LPNHDQRDLQRSVPEKKVMKERLKVIGMVLMISIPVGVVLLLPLQSMFPHL
jgi:hypothetical protein